MTEGVWTDGTWVFSTGLDQRIRCWILNHDGKLTQHAHQIISVPEPEALDARSFDGSVNFDLIQFSSWFIHSNNPNMIDSIRFIVSDKKFTDICVTQKQLSDCCSWERNANGQFFWILTLKNPVLRL